MNSAERLVELLTSLPSTKTATERKRSIESVEDLLSKDDVCACLDRASSSSGMSWRSVFNAVVQFVVSDLENIASNYSKTTTSSGRSAFSAVDRAKEHISVLKILLERLETRSHLPSYVSHSLSEKVLFLVVNQPYHYPPDCVCSHIRVFERFVLNAGRRLTDLNQNIFHDLLRSAAVSCAYFDPKKTPNVQPPVRVALAGLAVGLLRFSAEDLFSARPSVVCTLYSKYFTTLSEPSGADSQILQMLAAALPDACRSLRDYPHQLRDLIVEITPKVINLFTANCAKIGTDTSFITACHFIVSNLQSFIVPEKVPDALITKLWDATTKAMDDLVARQRYSSSTSSRRSVHPSRGNINQSLCDLYIAVAHFRLARHDNEETIIPPPSCAMLASSRIWLTVATKWLELHPEDIPVEFICNWCSWASAILSKPSKLFLHSDVLSLVLEIVHSPNGTTLPLSIHSQLWSSVQKAFSPSTVEIVFRILHVLMPIVFADRKEFNPVLSIPVPQLLAHPSLTVPFLLYFFTFDPPQRHAESNGAGSLHTELLAHLDSMGSDIFSNNTNPFDLVSLSQLLLFLFTEEVLINFLVEKEKEDKSQRHDCCPHTFFTEGDTAFSFSHFFTSDMYDPCDLLTLSNVGLPEKAKSHWLDCKIGKGNNFSSNLFLSTCCPPEIEVSYVKVVEDLQASLDKRFNSSNSDECFVKLCFVAHLALAGPLGKLGLLDYATKLSTDFAHLYCENSSEQSLQLSKYLNSFLTIAFRAKSPTDRQALLSPFLAPDFIDSLYQRIVDTVKTFASSLSNKGSLGDLTLVADNSMMMDLSDTVNGGDDKLSDSLLGNYNASIKKCVKPQTDLPVDHVRFLTDLHLLIALINYANELSSTSSFNEKVPSLLKRFQQVCKPRSRNIFFNCLALICNKLNVTSPEVYLSVCELIAHSLSIFFRDMHLTSLHIAFARELLLRNFKKMGCPFDNFRPFVSPLVTLYQAKYDNLTVIPKLQLFNFLCELASKSQPDSVYLQWDSGDIFPLRDMMLAFLSDPSLTIRLAAVKCLDTIIKASSVTNDFFQVFDKALSQSMKLPDGIRPTQEEINEECDNRKATFLLGLARMISLQGDNEALLNCRISSIGNMFRGALNFTPDFVRNALSLAAEWSGWHVLRLIEPISGDLAYYFVNEMRDEQINLERLLDIFFADELVNFGLLEAFLLVSLKNDPQGDVFTQCSNLPDLKEARGVAETVFRVKAVYAVLSGRTTTSSNAFNNGENCSNSDLAEIAVRTLLTSQRYISDNRTLIRLFELVTGTSGSSTLDKTLTQKRGFLPCLLAAFEKRLLLSSGNESVFSIDILRVYSKTCSAILSPQFCSLKDADFVMSHVFKTVLSALVLACFYDEKPRRGIQSTLSILLDDLAIPVMQEITKSNVGLASPISDFVAPIFAVSIQFLSKAKKSDLYDAFSKVRLLCIELAKYNATARLAFPFVGCFATFGSSSDNWLAELTNSPLFKNTTPPEICRQTRKCCRSLLRHKFDLPLSVDRILNVWASLADRCSDKKLASLLFQLALSKKTDGEKTKLLRLISSNLAISPTNLAHKCCLRKGFRDKNEDNEELLSQAAIVLTQLRHLLIFPAEETADDPNYWSELVSHAASLVASIPNNIFNQLPCPLINFFALFPTAASGKASNKNLLQQDVEMQSEESNVWTCPMAATQPEFAKWICSLAVFLVKMLPQSSKVFMVLMKNPSIIALLSKHCDMAQQLLPHVVSLLVRTSKDLINGTLEWLSNGFTTLLQDALGKQNRLVLNLVLDLVFYLRKEAVETLRHQQPPAVPRAPFSGGRFCPGEGANIVATIRPLSNSLGLDWWHLAQAADICGSSPAAALLYGQLYFETDLSADHAQQQQSKISVIDGPSNVMITSATISQLSAESKKLSVLARSAASLGPESGGGPDVVAGFVAVSDWAQLDLRFLYYSLTGQWSKALSISGRAQEAKTVEIRFNSGDIVENTTSSCDRYQLMWKLADWSRLPKCLSSQELADPKPDAAIYTALSSLNDSVVASFRTSGAERLSKFVIDSSLRKLTISLSEQASQLQMNTPSTRFLASKLVVLSHLGGLVEAWPEINHKNSFPRTLAQKSSEDVDFLKAAIHVLRTKVNGVSQIAVTEATQAVADMCNHLISDGKPMLAAKILRRHQPHCSQNGSVEFNRLVRLVNAHAARAIGETRQAINTLAGLLVDIRNSKPQSSFLQSNASQLFAKWNMDVNVVGGNDVDTIETLRSLLIAHVTGSNSNNSDLVEMHMALARYCEHRYRQLEAYIKSPSFSAKSTLTAQCKFEINEIKENFPSGRSNANQAPVQGSGRYMQSLETINRIDGLEIEFVFRQRNTFLIDALTSFLTVMRYSTVVEDIVAYRVVGLWLSNDENENVVQLISNQIQTIPSGKFVPLFYQIAARYCASSSLAVASKECLRAIIIRTSLDHPYHTLPTLLLLSSTCDNKANEISPPAQARGAKRMKIATPAAAITPPPGDNLARKLLNELKLKSPKMANLVDAYTRLRDAYVEFAEFNVGDKKGIRGDIPIPERFLRKTQLQPPLPLLTHPPQLQLSPGPDTYEKDTSFVLLDSIERNYRLLGGLNLPKLIRCHASDGQIYQQLVKGSNDDLRQDAVMQQVFKVVNTLFASSCDEKRPFNMRTYPIVPIGPQAGLIGFCDNAISLASYLIGQIDDGAKAVGAHSYYRPADMPAKDCRQFINNLSRNSTEKRIEALQKVYQQFKPVFRFYFIENFPDPVDFCRHRSTYSVSVAVSSMVGYILGLGDRHLQNILLDLVTSEVIHIDLGIAFEQGRTLSIPETVPFRLTRDIVDGFGPTGVEGLFRKSAEAALTILQKNREAIMTVLEVFSNDPLHLWTLNPLKAHRLEQNQSINAFFGGGLTSNRGGPAPSPVPSSRAPSAMLPGGPVETYRPNDNSICATRVLLQVDQKLSGEVAERGLKLSVPEQVELLIQQATAVNNLALIYCGWSPYA